MDAILLTTEVRPSHAPIGQTRKEKLEASAYHGAPMVITTIRDGLKAVNSSLSSEFVLRINA